MDFAALKDAIRTWTERSDYTDAQIEEFIALAEAGIRRRLVGYQREITSSMVADADGNIALPTDFLGIRSVFLGEQPYRYNISGSTLNVINGASRTFDVTYFGKLPALTASNTTNWLIEEAPDAYLWLTKAMAHAFNEEDSKAVGFQSVAYGIIDDLNLQSTVAQYSRTGLVLPVRAQ